MLDAPHVIVEVCVLEVDVRDPSANCCKNFRLGSVDFVTVDSRAGDDEAIGFPLYQDDPGREEEGRFERGVFLAFVGCPKRPEARDRKEIFVRKGANLGVVIEGGAGKVGGGEVGCDFGVSFEAVETAERVITRGAAGGTGHRGECRETNNRAAVVAGMWVKEGMK